ncbi:YrzE family protein [Mucilaginibacter sp. JRF]|uniref:acyl carrier protein n=1 Tax=Mucilaginibacter sp. JRF TaxID=2780088 RepID=UPI00188100A6|nr:YrzE family protein [Mucilaginibacter sp. JRF]MBE9585019.1 YrzE family protein [Mucilaginibacter sp. JRF]
MDHKLLMLKNVDREDLEDVLVKIERSFGVQFTPNDLQKIHTIGDLCNTVHSKLKLEHNDVCTTQHAFYMLRNAITTSTTIDRCAINTNTCLKDVFPEEERLQLVADMEHEMGLRLNVLQPKQSVIWGLIVLFILSVAAFYFNWQAGVVGLAAFAAGSFMAKKRGKQLTVKTVGQLAEKIAREHYLKCRRDAATVNRKEVNQKIRELFQHDLDLDASVLKSNASFN